MFRRTLFFVFKLICLQVHFIASLRNNYLYSGHFDTDMLNSI